MAGEETGGLALPVADGTPDGARSAAEVGSAAEDGSAAGPVGLADGDADALGVGSCWDDGAGDGSRWEDGGVGWWRGAGWWTDDAGLTGRPAGTDGDPVR